MIKIFSESSFFSNNYSDFPNYTSVRQQIFLQLWQCKSQSETSDCGEQSICQIQFWAFCSSSLFQEIFYFSFVSPYVTVKRMGRQNSLLIKGELSQYGTQLLYLLPSFQPCYSFTCGNLTPAIKQLTNVLLTELSTFIQCHVRGRYRVTICVVWYITSCIVISIYDAHTTAH